MEGIGYELTQRELLLLVVYFKAVVDLKPVLLLFILGQIDGASLTVVLTIVFYLFD